MAEIVHDVLHTERTIVFYQRDPDLPELEVAAVGLVDRLGVRSFLSLPLSTGTGRVGHILAGDVSGPRPWRVWERKFAGQPAAEATLVMESARLREIDRAHREQLLHQATHDALTGLANRRAFGVELTEALEAAVPSASAWPFTPMTAPTVRPCCRPPTPPCTRPSAAVPPTPRRERVPRSSADAGQIDTSASREPLLLHGDDVDTVVEATDVVGVGGDHSCSVVPCGDRHGGVDNV